MAVLHAGRLRRACRRAALDSTSVRRSWIIAAVVVGVLAIVVAALAARLTEDDGGSEDLEAWAGSVCTSVSDWRASILDLANVGAADLNAESLRGRLDDAEAATEELVSDLRDLGAPDVESGEELQDELDQTVSQLDNEFEGLQDDAQAVTDASSPTEFLQALAALAPRFQALLSGAADLLEQLETAPDVAEETEAELRQAFDDADACRELREAS